MQLQLLAVDLLELPTKAQAGSSSGSKAGGSSSSGQAAAAPKQAELFALDPITILEAVAPSKLAMMGDLAKGLCLGVRAIAQLLATVDAVAGRRGGKECILALQKQNAGLWLLGGFCGQLFALSTSQPSSGYATMSDQVKLAKLTVQCPHAHSRGIGWGVGGQTSCMLVLPCPQTSSGAQPGVHFHGQWQLTGWKLR